MPRVNRTEICATDEIQAFHLINRCVRRTYLCGEDVTTGKDYSHRKEWIRSRLEELAGIFAVDVSDRNLLPGAGFGKGSVSPHGVFAGCEADTIGVQLAELLPQFRILIGIFREQHSKTFAVCNNLKLHRICAE